MVEKEVVSKKYEFNKKDYKKILKGAGIAIAGAVSTVLLDFIPGIDFGQYTPLIVALNSVVCNMVLKFVSSTTYK